MPTYLRQAQSTKNLNKLKLIFKYIMNHHQKMRGDADRSNLNEGHCINPLTHQTELDYGIEPLLCIGLTQRAPSHLVRL